MALFAGLVMAGASIYGATQASSGQAQANTDNMQMNQANIDATMQRQVQSENFNAQQAIDARDWSAQQVQQQEQFQMGTQQQSEDWNQMMSDTAMQRRVADLKAAGLNPLLAVSQGGASAPVMSGLQGNVGSASQASAGIAGQPGMIPMQNASSAWGNLGGQMSNAVEAAKTGAQLDLLKAQTDKLNAESGQEIPAQTNYLKSMAGLTDQNATQAYTNTQLLQEKIYGQRLDNDQVRDILTPMQGQRLDILKATRDALISSTQSDATAKQLGLAGLRNLNDVQQSNLGKILSYINATLTPIGTAAKAAGSIGLSVP